MRGFGDLLSPSMTTMTPVDRSLCFHAFSGGLKKSKGKNEMETHKKKEEPRPFAVNLAFCFAPWECIACSRFCPFISYSLLLFLSPCTRSHSN